MCVDWTWSQDMRWIAQTHPYSGVSSIKVMFHSTKAYMLNLNHHAAVWVMAGSSRWSHHTPLTKYCAVALPVRQIKQAFALLQKFKNLLMEAAAERLSKIICCSCEYSVVLLETAVGKNEWVVVAGRVCLDIDFFIPSNIMEDYSAHETEKQKPIPDRWIYA